MSCSTCLSMRGHHTFPRSLALIRTIPWCPSCASVIVCFYKLSGITIRFPRMINRPKTHTSSDTALYIVPERRLQSPLVIAPRTSFKVVSFSEAISTCLGARAPGAAWLAMLHAYALVSLASLFWTGPAGRRLRVLAELSFPCICVTT